jgi:TolC family type I secretion outer membrane protein
VGAHPKIIVTLLVILVTPYSSFAMTLMESYQAAFANDPYFKMAYYSYLASKEEAFITRSQLLPELTLVSRYASNLGDREASNKFGVIKDKLNYVSQSTGLYFKQPLVNIEKYTMYQQGELQSQIAEKKWASGQQDLIARTVSAYLAVIVAEEKVQLTSAELRLQAAKYAAAQKFLVSGEATLSDVEFAETQRSLANIQHTDSVDKLDESKQTLAELTSSNDVSTTPTFRREAVSNSSSPPLLELINQAERSSLGIQEKELTLVAAEKNLDFARAGYFPTLDLTANYNQNNQDSLITLGQKSNTRSIGVELQWPLISGGKTSAQTRKAYALLQQAQQDLLLAHTRAKIEVGTQYHASQSNLNRLTTFNNAISAAQNNLKGVRDSARLGVKTTIDILAAERDLAQTNYDYADSLKNYLITSLKREAAIGILTEKNISWVENLILYAQPKPSY